MSAMKGLQPAVAGEREKGGDESSEAATPFKNGFNELSKIEEEEDYVCNNIESKLKATFSDEETIDKKYIASNKSYSIPQIKNNMATVSLSKGVFAFKNSKLRSQKDSAINIQKKWFVEATENDLGLLRKRNFKVCWQMIQDEIEFLLDQSHCKVFEDLILFLQSKGSKPLTLLSKDIPTACLVTGVNMPDHNSLFLSLCKKISRHVSPHSARLSPSDCPNLKTMVSKMVSGFMDESESYDFEDSDEEEEMSSKVLKKNNCNLQVLSAWYQHKYSLHTSPKKKTKRYHTSHPPLIVIVENVEIISNKVLADFVRLSSEYRHKVPLVLILGVSTTPSAVHSALHQEASACIAMETFQSLPSTELLASLIEKILMSPEIPIRIGGKAFKLLLDTFLYHDLSIRNFIKGFKFLVLQHFLTSPGAYICCSQDKRSDFISALRTPNVMALKSLPSVTKSLESMDEEMLSQLEDEENLKAFFVDQLADNDSKFNIFCILIKILHVFVEDLPRRPLGRKVREVLCLAFTETITESPEFNECSKLLSLSAKEELLPKITKACQILKDEQQVLLAELTVNLLCLKDRLEKVGMECESTRTFDAPVRLNLKPTDRFSLKEKLLEASSHMPSKPRTQFSVIREELLDLLNKWFQDYLQPPSQWIFNEAICFNPPTSQVRFHLLGGLRAVVTTGLSDPQKYLKCSCCTLSDAHQPSGLSDLSICYRLHLECGRHINLFDWMQAFITLVSGENQENTKPLRKNKKETVDQKLQARFVQAASELQFLGFIKPTKRKTDHVQRLTWGGC